MKFLCRKSYGCILIVLSYLFNLYTLYLFFILIDLAKRCIIKLLVMGHPCTVPVVSVVQLLSHVWLFATPMDCSAPGPSVLHDVLELRIFMSMSVMLSNHFILFCPFLLLASIFPSIRVFFQWIGPSHQVAKILKL